MGGVTSGALTTAQLNSPIRSATRKNRLPAVVQLPFAACSAVSRSCVSVFCRSPAAATAASTTCE